MKGACPFLAHTLIVNTFNFFAGFVKLAKNPHVVREVKVSQTIDLKSIKVSSLNMKNLLEQLQLCVATGSQQNPFARPPASFATFCPLLTRVNVNFSPHHHHQLDTNNNTVSAILRGGTSRDSRGAGLKRSNSDINLPDNNYRQQRKTGSGSKTNGADAPLAGSIVNITGKKLFFFRQASRNDTVRRSSTLTRPASLGTNATFNIASSPTTSRLQILQP